MSGAGVETKRLKKSIEKEWQNCLSTQIGKHSGEKEKKPG